MMNRKHAWPVAVLLGLVAVLITANAQTPAEVPATLGAAQNQPPETATQPRRKPKYEAPDDARDPFSRPGAEAPAQSGDPSASVRLLGPHLSDLAGRLTLRGTMGTDAKSGIEIIDGDIYKVGGTILVLHDGEKHALKLTHMQFDPPGVVLSYRGEKTTLLEKPKKEGR